MRRSHDHIYMDILLDDHVYSVISDGVCTMWLPVTYITGTMILIIVHLLFIYCGYLNAEITVMVYSICRFLVIIAKRVILHTALLLPNAEQ